MVLNKKHPDCTEYKAKFDAIWDEYALREKEECAKYPDWHGQDHPADAVLYPLRRKRNMQINALKKEYSYLFTEDPDDK